MVQFNPKRLEQARKRRGMTRRDLARETGIAERTLSYNEAGRHLPSDHHLHLLAHTLHFPVGFFFLDDPEPLSSASVSFRAMSRMLARQRDQALAGAELAFELSAWLDARFNLPSPDFPDWRDEINPESAAVALRSYWCLGDRPITNMVHLLEKNGVRVFSLADDCETVDAFSFWKGERPYVLLNTMKSGERGRYDAAHELAHLVLHRHHEPKGREAEAEANRFAACFLMPSSSVVARSPKSKTLANLVRAKGVWGVSVLALARRMYELELLTEWRYRQICIRAQQYGMRKEEPHALSHETSQVLQKVFKILWSRKMLPETIATDLGWPIRELDALTFRSLLSDRHSKENTNDEKTNRPKLRVV